MSQINGCAFASGTCTIVQQSDPVAALSSEISLITNATIDDSPSAPAADDADEGEDGSSDDQDEADDSDEGSAPIVRVSPAGHGAFLLIKEAGGPDLVQLQCPDESGADGESDSGD
jgi:hypothetical protein